MKVPDFNIQTLEEYYPNWDKVKLTKRHAKFAKYRKYQIRESNKVVLWALAELSRIRREVDEYQDGEQA